VFDAAQKEFEMALIIDSGRHFVDVSRLPVCRQDAYVSQMFLSHPCATGK
jgi:hypothetical protein